MDLISNILQAQGFLILDGAMATELERYGKDLKHPLWSAKALIEAPDLIRKIHFYYFLAGSDVATTASYQASLIGFSNIGCSPEAAANLLKKSVELACSARDDFWAVKENRVGRIRPLVAASIGPYGAYLADGSEYRGYKGISDRVLINFHLERMKILADTGVDLFAFETIPCMQEARILLEVLETMPGKTAWLSYSCRNNLELCGGEPFAAAAALANHSIKITAVGVNCTAPAFVKNLMHIARTNTDKPLLAYPNSGETWDTANHCWLGKEHIVNWVEMAKTWYEAGAKILGGCCRTTPEDIRELRTIIGGQANKIF